MVVTDTDWEDFDDLDNFGISICTSGTRPTAHEGRHIYETDTNKTMVYTGAAWVELAGTGGGDFYADGSVPMTGDLTFNMVDPEIIFDTGDYLQYDKTDNYLHVVIGSAVIASFKNDRIIHNYINYHNANIDMNTYKVVDLGAHTTNGDAIRFEHIALDEHTQYLLANGSRSMTGDLTFNMVDPEIIFDTGDYLQYDKTDNYLHVIIGSATIASFKNDRIIHNYINYHNANIDMNTYKIVDLADPTTDQEAATKKYVDDTTGVTDHGALTGLTDDDHTQYLLVAGTRAMTGDLTFNKTDAAVWFATGDSIWLDSSENRLYFEIASTNICYVRSTGIHPNTDSTYYLGSGSAYWKGLYADDVVVEAGTYMTGDGTGNMELHVATGKTVKIVVG